MNHRITCVQAFITSSETQCTHVQILHTCISYSSAVLLLMMIASVVANPCMYIPNGQSLINMWSQCTPSIHGSNHLCNIDTRPHTHRNTHTTYTAVSCIQAHSQQHCVVEDSY